MARNHQPAASLASGFAAATASLASNARASASASAGDNGISPTAVLTESFRVIKYSRKDERQDGFDYFFTARQKNAAKSFCR